MPDQALNGIKVLDIGHHIAGPYCSKLLADFGAEVIKLEKPEGGDPARRLGPFPDDRPNPHASGTYIYLNNNKLGITLNLKSETGISIFRELVKKVDVLVENYSPRVMTELGITYDTLKAVNPGLVMISISNFGQTGPYRDYKATDIVIQALGGWMWNRGQIGREPVRAAGKLRITEFIGGVYGAVGATTALAYKFQSGTGQHVDVSLMEAMICLQNYPTAVHTFPKHAPVPASRYEFIPGIEQCKDGYIAIFVLTQPHWVGLCQMMGMDDLSEHPDYTRLAGRLMHRQELAARMRPWLMEHTVEEILNEGQAWRIPTAMVYSTKNMLESPQYMARDFFAEIEQTASPTVTQPGTLFKMEETPWQIRRPAPILGEHNEEIYGKLLGYKNDDVVRLRQAGII